MLLFCPLFVPLPSRVIPAKARVHLAVAVSRETTDRRRTLSALKYAEWIPAYAGMTISHQANIAIHSDQLPRNARNFVFLSLPISRKQNEALHSIDYGA